MDTLSLMEFCLGTVFLVSPIQPTSPPSGRIVTVYPNQNYTESCEPILEGRTIDGRTIDGRTIDGRTINGRTINGRTINGRTIDGRTIDGHTIDGRIIDGRTWTINNSALANTNYTRYVSIDVDNSLFINCVEELNNTWFQCSSREKNFTLRIQGPLGLVIEPKVNLSADPDNVLIHWLPPYSMGVPENTTWFNVKILNGSEVLIKDENVTTHFTCIRKELFEPGHVYSCIISSWNVAGKGESVTVQVMIPGPTPTMQMPLSSIAAIILVLLVAYFLYERLVKYDGRHLLDVVEKSPMDILSPRQASDGVTNYLTIAPNGQTFFKKPDRTSSSHAAISYKGNENDDKSGQFPQYQERSVEGTGNAHQDKVSEDSVSTNAESSSEPSNEPGYHNFTNFPSMTVSSEEDAKPISKQYYSLSTSGGIVQEESESINETTQVHLLKHACYMISDKLDALDHPNVMPVEKASDARVEGKSEEGNKEWADLSGTTLSAKDKKTSFLVAPPLPAQGLCAQTSNT